MSVKKLKPSYRGKAARQVSSFLVTQTPKQFLLGIVSQHEQEEPDIIDKVWWKNTQKLLWHIFRCSLFCICRSSGWVAISSRFVQKNFRDARWKVLAKLGFIESRCFSERQKGDGTAFKIEYLIDEGYCREFRVPLDLIELIADLTLADLNEGKDLQVYDLVRQRGVSRPIKSELWDENRNPIHQSIRDRILAIDACQFNDLAIRQHLQRSKQVVEEARQEFGAKSREYRSARARYLNDFGCYHTLRVCCRAVPFKGNIWVYKPAYRAQTSGRISHIGGGLQSASKAMQTAAFWGIEGYWNGDMPSAQPKAMIQLMSQAKVDTSWLENYISTPNAKQELAEQIGISVSAWKACLNAMLMGTQIFDLGESTLNHFVGLGSKIGFLKQQVEVGRVVNQGLFAPPAIMNQLLRAFNYDGYEAYSAYVRLYTIAEPLINSLRLYHSYIKNTVIPQAPRTTKYGQYIENQVGARIYLNELMGNREAKIVAHLLQGLEAAFMVAIFQLKEKYNFSVHQDMHDGAIFSGEIPPGAIEEACILSGVSGSLEVKPFE